MWIVPALVFAVVMTIAFIVAVLLPAFVLAVVVAIAAVAILTWRRERECASQSHE
jgi:hypothetical protein